MSKPLNELMGREYFLLDQVLNVVHDCRTLKPECNLTHVTPKTSCLVSTIENAFDIGRYTLGSETIICPFCIKD